MLLKIYVIYTLMMQKKKSEAQKKANARNQLFRQIHGYSLTSFVNKAREVNAITSTEDAILTVIEYNIKYLKEMQFDNSKKLNMHPRRRCFCNGIAKWACVDKTGNKRLLCNKHKKQWEEDESLVSFKHINPYV